MVKQRFPDVDAYLASFPESTRAKLAQVRRAIRAAVPDAEERVSYHMPTYAREGRVLYFSGYKAHWSLHGNVEEAREALGERLAGYSASGRGTLRFPLEKKVPVALVKEIARRALRP